MQLADVQRFVQGGESETKEYKETTAEIRKAVETTCAFLNTDGGKVFIGWRESLHRMEGKSSSE